MKNIISIIVFLISFFSFSQNIDYVWTGAVNYDWNNPFNWLKYPFLVVDGTPNASHNVYCPSNAFLPLKIFPDGSQCNTLTIDAANNAFVIHSINIDNHLVCNSLIIENDNGQLGLQMNAGKIEVIGNVVNKAYTRLIGGDFIVHGNIINHYNFLVYPNAQVNVNGDFNNVVDLSTISYLSLLSNSEIKIGGDLNWNKRIFLFGNSEIHVDGNVNMGSTSEANFSSTSKVYCKGNWNGSLVTDFNPSAGNQIIFNGDTQQVCILNSSFNNYFENIVIDKSDDTVVIVQNEVLVNGDFEVISGKLKIENATLLVNGNFNSQNPFSKIELSSSSSRLELSGEDNVITGGVSTNSGTVAYNRIGEQTIAPINYYNLEIKNQGIKAMTNNSVDCIYGDFHVFPDAIFELDGFVFLSGDTILNEGTLKINESLIYATNQNGIFDVSNDGIIDFTDNSNVGRLLLKGNVLSLGNLDNNGGRVGYVSTNSQQIDVNVVYNVLESWNGPRTIIGDLKINNELKIENSTINTNGNTIELGVSSNSTGALNNTNGFINGKFKRWFGGTNNGAGSGLFPLSDNSGNKRFIKVEYQEATDGGTLTAEWIPESMGFNYTLDQINTSCNGPFAISNICTEGYWSMTPADGITNNETKNYNITLDAEAILSFVDDCHLSAVKRTGNSAWEINGSHEGNFDDEFNPNVVINNAKGWSNWGFVGGSGSALPVELSVFTASCESDGILLSWVTESEYNSLDFIIEKSADGLSWDNISFVQASGNSTQKLNYSFLDNTRNNNAKYYRLIQRDIDGFETSYDPIFISCEKNNNVLQTYPNPSSEKFNISLDSKTISDLAKVRIIDLKGNELYGKQVVIDNGVNNVLISYHLEKGVYLIIVEAKNLTLSCKHVVN